MDAKKPQALPRPSQHLIGAGKLFPDVWRSFDDMRAGRGKGATSDWPDWCWCPMAAAASIVAASRGFGLHSAGHVASLTALGAWRLSQGIYRFDETLYDAIRQTPVDGDLPCEVLYRMPEYCMYIETPHGILGGDLAGFFVHLEHDTNTRRAELRLLLDIAGDEPSLIGMPLHLGPWSLETAIAKAEAEATRQRITAGLAIPQAPAGGVRATIEPLVSLVLYLCAEGSELDPAGKRPARPQPVKTKKGLRSFPAERVTTWDVGVRLGAALRRAYAAEDAADAGERPHGSPRGHVRRAHWHGYRHGARKRADGTEIPATDRPLALKWLPPIPVALDAGTELPAVVHRVKL